VGGIGLLGGAFDPPHLGHVALARAAKEHLALERLVVLVAVQPGHKHVATPLADRLELSRAAFPDDEVRVDGHARTVELLRDGEWDEPWLVIGADQFRDFPFWREPDAVLQLARLAVGTRPGYERGELEAARARLSHPGRVELFDVQPHDVSSNDIRRRAAAGEPLTGLVPSAVERLVAERQVYQR
jgi:nicotinate-nucleotide adenylyltransferase